MEKSIDKYLEVLFRGIIFAIMNDIYIVNNPIDNIMEDKSLQLLTEEELEILKKFEQCTTIEELKQLEREVNILNENKSPIEYEDMDMSTEEFKEKYDLIDIRDLNGKYGF